MAAVSASRALPTSQIDHSMCHAREEDLVKQVAKLKEANESLKFEKEFIAQSLHKWALSEADSSRDKGDKIVALQEKLEESTKREQALAHRVTLLQQKKEEAVETATYFSGRVEGLKSENELLKQEVQLWMDKTKEVVAVADRSKRLIETQKKQLEALQRELQNLKVTSFYGSKS